MTPDPTVAVLIAGLITIWVAAEALTKAILAFYHSLPAIGHGLIHVVTAGVK